MDSLETVKLNISRLLNLLIMCKLLKKVPKLSVSRNYFLRINNNVKWLSVPPIKICLFQCNVYNPQYFYEIFQEKWISTAGPGQFSWKFSILTARNTDISITNCNTTRYKLTSKGFTGCWVTTERHFHVFVRAHALSVLLV